MAIGAWKWAAFAAGVTIFVIAMLLKLTAFFLSLPSAIVYLIAQYASDLSDKMEGAAK